MEHRPATILVAEITGLKPLEVTGGVHGNERFVELIETVAHHVSANGGSLIGNSATGLAARFDGAADAVRCATEVLQSINGDTGNWQGDKKPGIRIGVDEDNADVQSGQVGSEGVRSAGRLIKLAGDGDICISGSVRKQLGGSPDFEIEEVRSGEGNGTIGDAYVVRSKATRGEMHSPSGMTNLPWRNAAFVAGLSFIVVIIAIVAWQGRIASFFEPAIPRSADAPMAAGQSVPLPTGPRIALIPFRNLSRDSNDAFFSEGLTRDINAQLSRFSNLFVIAPEAAAAYRGNPDCQTIRKELKADYVLTGTVQRDMERVRVTTEFLDTRSCIQQTPPGPFDRDLSVSSVLDIQLEIASKVASEVGSGDAPLFNVAVQRAIRAKAPSSLNAYECVLQGYWFYQTFAAREHSRARTCLERTVAREPDYSLAWSRLAFVYMEARKFGIDAPADWAERAGKAAATALEKDPDNPDGFYAKAALSRMKGDDINVFLENANKAISLNPNDSWILADLGTWLAYSGEWENGEVWITRARELNPKLHPGFNNVWHLHAFARGDYQTAINIMLSLGGQVHMNLVSLAASYAFNGDHAKAEEVVARLREKYPDFSGDPRAPFRARGMPEPFIDKLMEGLQMAGYDVPPK